MGGKLRTAKGSFDFVTIDGKIYVGGKDSGHINISHNADVDYAGTVSFGQGQSSKGKLQRFDNDTGHYETEAEYARQSGFPADKFVERTEK